MCVTPDELPKYVDLILPTLRAVVKLGGSAATREVSRQVIEDENLTDDMLAVAQPNRPEASVLGERMSWARSYAKLIGALESPRRGVVLVTAMGKELVALPSAEGLKRVVELDREYRRNRSRKRTSKPPSPVATDTDDAVAQADAEGDVEALFEQETTGRAPERWQEVLLARLHHMSPDGFEEFVLYLLRLYGLELERVGGVGDEGVDGIGTASISPVLSSRVAVQVKRYDPQERSIGREVVALFQRDAQTKGAERAILVTLGRFTEPARKAAILASPTVDLIDGEKLAELVKEQKLGVRLVPRVDPAWFDKFD